jgi:hypothetical protein
VNDKKDGCDHCGDILGKEECLRMSVNEELRCYWLEGNSLKQPPVNSECKNKVYFKNNYCFLLMIMIILFIKYFFIYYFNFYIIK